MKCAIIGANGQVGREISHILMKRGHEIVPVVRSKRAASVFSVENINHRLLDDCNELNGDVDVVIVSAFTSYMDNSHLKPKNKRKENEDIISKSVSMAPENSKIIYFSSINAFGNKVHNRSNWYWYTKEKQYCENFFKKKIDNKTNRGYILRLGHVFGPTQAKTLDIQKRLNKSTSIVVSVNPETFSNIIHSSNLVNVVSHIHNNNIEEDIYTAVNVPQWTWGDVFDYYSQNQSIKYEYNENNKTNNEIISISDKRLFNFVLEKIPVSTEFLIGISPYIPEKIVKEVSYERLLKNKTSENIQSYKNKFRYDRREFHYKKVPEPYVNYNQSFDVESESQELREFFVN